MLLNVGTGVPVGTREMLEVELQYTRTMPGIVAEMFSVVAVVTVSVTVAPETGAPS